MRATETAAKKAKAEVDRLSRMLDETYPKIAEAREAGRREGLEEAGMDLEYMGHLTSARHVRSMARRVDSPKAEGEEP